MAFRVDIGELRPAVRLADGRLRVDGRIARTGIQIYHDAAGNEIREYRPPEQVFDDQSVKSFDYSIVTDDHPADTVTAHNARALGVGQVVGAVRRGDEQWLTAPMVINDADMIAKLEAGKVQLSCGYHADVELTGGVTPEGERYDAIQKNIRGNHVAIVDSARAGSNARIRLDGTGNAFIPPTPPGATPEMRIDHMPDLQKKYSDALADAAEQKARADKTEAELTAANERADKAEADRDSATGRADVADKAKADAEASFSDRVAARVSLEAKAHTVLDEADKPADFTGKTDREVRVAVIEKLGGTIPNERADSDAYIDARFDGMLESAQRSDGFDAFRALAPTAPGGASPARHDANEFDEAAAMRAMHDRANKAWQSDDE